MAVIKLVWKYFIPIFLVVAGSSVLASDPGKPYSMTIPIVLGAYQAFVGIGLLVVGLLVAAAIIFHDRKEKDKS